MVKVLPRLSRLIIDSQWCFNQCAALQTCQKIQHCTRHSVRAKESHRAKGLDPLQLDLAVDVCGVARESQTLVVDEDHSCGRLHVDCRWSNGNWGKV